MEARGQVRAGEYLPPHIYAESEVKHFPTNSLVLLLAPQNFFKLPLLIGSIQELINFFKQWLLQLW